MRLSAARYILPSEHNGDYTLVIESARPDGDGSVVVKLTNYVGKEQVTDSFQVSDGVHTPQVQTKLSGLAWRIASKVYPKFVAREDDAGSIDKYLSEGRVDCTMDQFCNIRHTMESIGSVLYEQMMKARTK